MNSEALLTSGLLFKGHKIHAFYSFFFVVFGSSLMRENVRQQAFLPSGVLENAVLRVMQCFCDAVMLSGGGSALFSHLHGTKHKPHTTQSPYSFVSCFFIRFYLIFLVFILPVISSFSVWWQFLADKLIIQLFVCYLVPTQYFTCITFSQSSFSQ